MVRIGQTSISDESVTPALSEESRCELGSAVGSAWATGLLNTPGLTHGDIVWLNAKAEEAFTRTYAAQSLQKDSPLFRSHKRGFISGAVDSYESAYQLRNLGFSIEPEPIPGLYDSLATATVFNHSKDSNDSAAYDKDEDELDKLRFNEYDE